MFENCKNTKDQGNIGLGMAIQYFSSIHSTVSIPLNDSQDYDLIVDINGVLKRIQVKTCNYVTKRGNWGVNLKVNGGSSKTNRIMKRNNDIIYDLLFVVCGDGSKFLIPKEKITQRNFLTITKTSHLQYRI